MDAFMMNASEGSASAPAEKFLHIPFSQRWKHLKPAIKKFYVDERHLPGHELSGLVTMMKSTYQFDAVEHQYKYHLREWGFGKSVPNKVKEEACYALGKRTRDHTSTPTVEYNGEEIQKTKLRRYMISKAKQDTTFLINTKIFITWNLPYRALRASRMGDSDTKSPFGARSTPSYLSVLSPGDQSPRNALTPRNAHSLGIAASPHDAPSPTTVALRSKQMADRAKLLVQGRHDELLGSMSKDERKIATTWLYQFWLFSYKTAKHWGRGPEDWSESVLRFTEFEDVSTAVNTPMPNIYENENEEDNNIQQSSEPYELCLWSIHVTDRMIPGAGRIPLLRPVHDYDNTDERYWPEWENRNIGSVEKLQNALKNNTFSNVDTDALPLSLTEVAKSAEQSPDHLLLETIGFAIMGRNEDLLWDLIEDTECLDFSCLEPFHLAASYLCGAKTCCNILDFVNRNFSGPRITQKLYINYQGHTVLDILLMGILKSHTSCAPSTVDEKFANQKRWTGEELDICGRWDADSPCIRKLLAKGKSTIPVMWKHMFCHTSAQTVCHSIGTIFGARFAPDINTPSGLFKKSCTCGRQLVLQPLHCLVMVAFHLAHNGRPGENLFGILACLVSLLVNGANPLIAAYVSVDMLLGSAIVDECSHASLDPYQLARQIPEEIIAYWPEETRLGWAVFCLVLEFAQKERRSVQSQTLERRSDKTPFRRDFGGIAIDEELNIDQTVWDVDEEDSDEEDGEIWCTHHKLHHGNFYDGSKEIGKLWAAIQTELLTYRKIENDDPWISKNFAMNDLLSGLENNFGCSLLLLVDNEMMKPVCRCGRFREAVDEACVMVQEASKNYFSNNDVWARATYILVPEWRSELWYDD